MTNEPRKCHLLSTTPNMDGTFNGVFQDIETGQLLEAKNCYPVSVEMPDMKDSSDQLFMTMTFNYGDTAPVRKEYVPSPANTVPGVIKNWSITIPTKKDG